MAKDLNDIASRLTKAAQKLTEEQGKSAQFEAERKDFMKQVGTNIADMMRPLMERVLKMATFNKEAIKEAISELNITVPPPIIPPIQIPKIEVPEAKITVRPPEVKMPDEMSATIVGHSIDYKKPIPVVLTNENGKSYIAGAIGGGGLNISKIRFQGVDINGVARTALVDDAGRLQVDIVTGASGSTMTLTDNMANEDQVGQIAFLAGWDSAGGNWDRIRSGSGTGEMALRVVHATDVAASVSISGSTGSIAVSILNGDGNALDPRDRNWTITESIETKQVSGFTSSVNVVGFAVTAAVVGNVVSDAADGGDAPVKIGGIARTTNPTAVADGDRVSGTFDKVGRIVNTPVQVRALRATAFATLNTNSETTLLAGASGVFHDLTWIKFSNTSSGAVTIDLRNATGGTIVDTWEVPANGVTGVSMPVPWPQDEAATPWTVDFNDTDLSNTTVYVSGLFVKEV